MGLGRVGEGEEGEDCTYAVMHVVMRVVMHVAMHVVYARCTHYPVHTRLEALDVATHIGLRFKQMTLMELGEGLLLLVGADDVALHRFDHQKTLAKRTYGEG